MATMTRIPICKKKREERKKRRLGEKEERKEEGKYILQKRGLKKSGGGPPDLSGVGSREWVSSLKGPSSTRKECPAPMDVCDLKICIDRCVCIKFQRRGTQFELRLECVLFKD